MKAKSLLSISTLVVSMAFLITACHKSNDNTPTANKVSISGMAYSPASLTVATGSTVTWTNTDTAVHSVATADGSINSGDITAGSSYTQTFANAGTFNYYDTHNKNMTGVLIITKSSGSGY